MVIFLFTIAIMSSVLSGISYKYGSMKFMGRAYATPLLCAINTLISAIIYAVILFATVPQPSFSSLTLVFSLMSGTSLAVAAVLFLTALECGPYTVTSALLNFSSFLPILYSWIFLKEDVTLRQLIGLVLLMGIIAVLVFFGHESKKSQNKVNVKWIILVSLMVIVNSIIPFAVRCQTVFVPNASKEMLFLHFTIAFVASLIMLVIFGGFKAGKTQLFTTAKNIFIPAIGLSVGLGLNLLTHTYLPILGVSSALQYPIICSGSVMLSTIAGKVLFHDKIRPIAYVALLAGLGVIILISA